MATAPLRGVGIVGLTPGRSWAARAHVPAQTAANAAQALDIPRSYASADELVADLAVGKAVYCEWPLGNGLADAEAMADTARRVGRQHGGRLNPSTSRT